MGASKQQTPGYGPGPVLAKGRVFTTASGHEVTFSVDTGVPRFDRARSGIVSRHKKGERGDTNADCWVHIAQGGSTHRSSTKDRATVRNYEKRSLHSINTTALAHGFAARYIRWKGLF
jgi:hypothetical protein